MPRACDARARAAGICEPQACHSDRDSAHGYTAPKGQLRVVPVREHGDAVGELAQRRTCCVAATCLDVRREAEHGLSAGVGPVGDEPRGCGPAVDRHQLAVLVEHLPVDGVDGELQPFAEELGEGFVGWVVRGCERCVALAECPDGAGDPVGRVTVGRVWQLHRLRAGVQRAIGLHPEHDVARVLATRRLEVGQAAQHLVRRVAAARSSRSRPSAGCRRLRRARRRRR